MARYAGYSLQEIEAVLDPNFVPAGWLDRDSDTEPDPEPPMKKKKLNLSISKNPLVSQQADLRFLFLKNSSLMLPRV